MSKKPGTFDEALDAIENWISYHKSRIESCQENYEDDVAAIKRLRAAITVLKACERARVQSGIFELESEKRVACAILKARKIAEKKP